MRKLRSQAWFGGRDKDGFVHRSWMKNNGLPEDAFDGRPVIGICNTFSEFTPCNAHFRDIAAKVKAGEINFDVVVASPDAMRVVGQLGQILGPRGLMPNPKVGTVTPDVAGAVKNAKAGQVRYRVDKAGIIHCTIGKATFESAHLKDNLSALIADLQKAKPSSAKGQYLKRVTLSSTMGPGVVVDQSTLG